MCESECAAATCEGNGCSEINYWVQVAGTVTWIPQAGYDGDHLDATGGYANSLDCRSSTPAHRDHCRRGGGRNLAGWEH